MDSYERWGGPQKPEPTEFDTRQVKKALSRMGWGVFALMGLTQLASGALFVALNRPEWQNLTASPWFPWFLNYLPLYLFAFPIFWLIVRKIPAQRPRGGAACGLGTFVKLVLLSLAITYSLNFVSALINYLIGLVKGAAVMNPLAEVAVEPISTFVFGGLVAPVMEEVVFRKILLGRLLPMGEDFAVYGSAVIFALFHANLSQLLYAFVLGVVLSRLTVATGGIRWSILLHIVINNIGAVVVPIIAGIEGWGIYAVGGFLLVIIPAGFWMLKFLPKSPLAPSPLPLTRRKKVGAFAFNPGMIAYNILILLLIVVVTLA